jgi:hypothetical protein
MKTKILKLSCYLKYYLPGGGASVEVLGTSPDADGSFFPFLESFSALLSTSLLLSASLSTVLGFSESSLGRLDASERPRASLDFLKLESEF